MKNIIVFLPNNHPETSDSISHLDLLKRRNENAEVLGDCRLCVLLVDETFKGVLSHGLAAKLRILLDRDNLIAQKGDEFWGLGWPCQAMEFLKDLQWKTVEFDPKKSPLFEINRAIAFTGLHASAIDLAELSSRSLSDRFIQTFDQIRVDVSSNGFALLEASDESGQVAQASKRLGGKTESLGAALATGPQAREFSTGRSRDAATFGPVLYLAVVTSGEFEISRAAFRALHEQKTRPDSGQRNWEEPAIILISSDADKLPGSETDLSKLRPSCMEFSCSPGVEQVVTAIVEEAESGRPNVLSILSRTARGPVVRMSAGEGAEADLNSLIDSLLNAMLLGNRPVADWRTSFMVSLSEKAAPWQSAKIGEQSTVGSAGSSTFRDRFSDRLTMNLSSNAMSGSDGALGLVAASREESGYFLPEMRDLIAPLKPDEGTFSVAQELRQSLKDRQRRLTFEITANLPHLELNHANYGPNPITIPINAIRLHFSEDDTFVLEWEVGSRQSETPFHGVFWKEMLLRKEIAAPSLARVIDLNAELRFAYLTYRRKTADIGGHTRDVALRLIGEKGELVSRNYDLAFVERSQTSQFIKELFRFVAGENLDDRMMQLTDDRARVMTSIILEGSHASHTTSLKLFKPLLAQINMVDPYGYGHPYSVAQSSRELSESSYDRFADFGSRFMATEHSMSFVGHRHHDDYANGTAIAAGEERPLTFAEENIHKIHMAQQYKRLFLHFLFGEAAVRSLAIEFAAIDQSSGHDKSEIDRSKLGSLRLQLANISGRLRQPNLSSQLQGRELTELLARRFKLESEWEALERKIVTLEGLHHAEAEQIQQRLSNRLSWFVSGASAYVFISSTKPAATGGSSEGADGSETFGFLWQLIECVARGMRRIVQFVFEPDLSWPSFVHYVEISAILVTWLLAWGLHFALRKSAGSRYFGK
jgi:hypothetical protein